MMVEEASAVYIMLAEKWSEKCGMKQGGGAWGEWVIGYVAEIGRFSGIIKNKQLE